MWTQKINYECPFLTFNDNAKVNTEQLNVGTRNYN